MQEQEAGKMTRGEEQQEWNEIIARENERAAWERQAREERTTTMRILNFAHPFTLKTIEEITEEIGEGVSVTVVPVNLDLNKYLVPQITAIVDGLRFTSAEWQTENFLINLPGFAPAAAVLLAELHGRMGHFPVIIRLVQLEGKFHLAELINLQP